VDTILYPHTNLYPTLIIIILPYKNLHNLDFYMNCPHQIPYLRPAAPSRGQAWPSAANCSKISVRLPQNTARPPGLAALLRLLRRLVGGYIYKGYNLAITWL
jgi:hypothetical protein